jgi:N-acetylglucosamine kinase-like BadF-type ATPase
MTETVRYYLGIDAGGTKTHALIIDSKGRALGAGESGPGNWEGVGLDGACEAYAAATARALDRAGLRAGDLSGAGYALAGLDFPSDEDRLGPVVARLGVPGAQVLVNDAYGALRAGTRQGYGVVIIAGTGTTVGGISRRGERFRTFGEGRMTGDIGGAGDIVWMAIQAVARAHTGRGEPTALSQRLYEIVGVSDTVALMEVLMRGQRRVLHAGHAPLVFEVADAGDPAARNIIRKAGRELGANAAAVARRLNLCGEAFELVLAGGVFRSGSQLLLDTLLETVRAAAPGVQPVRLSAPPVLGGVLLAMDADGRSPTPEMHDRLATEATALLGGTAAARDI